MKQTAKFIMMLLILSLAYVMPAATTKKIQQVSTVPKKTLTVLLDAGHGADDSGKVGINHVSYTHLDVYKRQMQESL